jgi:PAS domain S-box-containing protein
MVLLMTQAAILVVEDEAIVALDLRAQLEAMGHRVVGIADNAAQALELARSHRPQLALMDIVLRGDVDGVETAATLRRELGTPVIFLTSFSDPATVRRAAETGAHGYLTKPFQTKELRAGIEVALYKARMEEQLREADRWFASTLRCVTDAVVVTELDARVRFMNPAAEALTGWPIESAQGLPVREVVRVEPDVDLAGRVLRDGRATGIEHGLRLRAFDGHEAPVDHSAAPIDDDGGKRMGAVLVLRDARPRLRQEERLRASEERFRSAFDLAPLGMALVALGGQTLMVNDAMCRLLERDASSLRGTLQADLAHPTDHEHERQRIHELLTGSLKVVQFEKRYLLPAEAGRTRSLPTLVSASLLHQDDEPACVLYQVLDLTQQRLAAQQMTELTEERMRREASEATSRAKSEFLSRVSHEMRTPLNAVLGFGQLLQMGAASGGAANPGFVDHILGAGRHLLNMVNDLLDIQQGEQGALKLTMQSVALSEAVDACVAMLRPDADVQGIGLVVDVPTDVRVLADSKRLHQVLLNLGSNAIKYNRAGGQVRWALQPAAAGQVRLAVLDDGIGMTGEQLAKLFQPFERLGREKMGVPGTGLGMLISRNLIEHMGGRLQVLSEPRKGTTVVLELASA